MELKEELALRRAVESAANSAPNPDAAETQITVLLDQIKIELEVARREKRPGRASVTIPFNSRERHVPALTALQLFLVARGYAVTVNPGTIIISWS